jgi:hypothetical protein
MVNKCASPGCKSGYVTKESKVSFHKFPKDPPLRAAWTQAVPRKD